MLGLHIQQTNNFQYAVIFLLNGVFPAFSTNIQVHIMRIWVPIARIQMLMQKFNSQKNHLFF